MKILPLRDRSAGPLEQEIALRRGLQEAAACGTERLRLTIAGRHLFLDGFVESLDDKLRAERVCRELAPGSIVVNRLRVAAAEERQVS